MLYLGRIFISIIAGLKVQLKEEVLEDSADIIEMEVQDPLGWHNASENWPYKSPVVQGGICFDKKACSRTENIVA